MGLRKTNLPQIKAPPVGVAYPTPVKTEKLWG